MADRKQRRHDSEAGNTARKRKESRLPNGGMNVHVSHRLGEGQGDESLSLTFTASPGFSAFLRSLEPTPFRKFTRNTPLAPAGMLFDLWTLPARALFSERVTVSVQKEPARRDGIVEAEYEVLEHNDG